jgi:hypothetical protein
MTTELKSIRSEADHEKALREVESLWGAKSGTTEGDRLDILATLIDAYEARRYHMNHGDPVELTSHDKAVAQVAQPPASQEPALGRLGCMFSARMGMPGAKLGLDEPIDLQGDGPSLNDILLGDRK